MKREKEKSRITIYVCVCSVYADFRLYAMLWFEAVQKLWSIICRLNHFFCQCCCCGNETHFDVSHELSSLIKMEYIVLSAPNCFILCALLLYYTSVTLKITNKQPTKNQQNWMRNPSRFLKCVQIRLHAAKVNERWRGTHGRSERERWNRRTRAAKPCQAKWNVRVCMCVGS